MTSQPKGVGSPGLCDGSTKSLVQKNVMIGGGQFANKIKKKSSLKDFLQIRTVSTIDAKYI